MRYCLLLICGILLSVGLSAQAPITKKGGIKPLKAGFGLMATGYLGDLNYQSGQMYNRFYPGFNVSLQFANEKFFYPQLNVGYGRFVAQNRKLEPVEGYNVNKFVSTAVFYADIRMKFRAFPRKMFQPYVSVGVGILNYTPKDADRNSLSDNFESRKEEETYGSVTAGFPLSGGLDVKLSHIVAIGIEYTHRITLTDYLDNIGELGGFKGKDHLTNLTLSAQFTFDPERKIRNQNLRGKDRQ